jgi:hypothetical protein
MRRVASVGLVAFLMVLGGCARTTKPSVVVVEKTDPDSHGGFYLAWDLELAEAYEKDEASAAAKYTGKDIEFLTCRDPLNHEPLNTGPDNTFVAIFDCGPRSQGKLLNPPKVICWVDKEHVATWTAAKRCQLFHVRGRCEGNSTGAVVVRNVVPLTYVDLDGEVYKERPIASDVRHP